MNELQNKINKYFEQPDTASKVAGLIAENFSEGQKESVNNILKFVQEGDVECDSFYDSLVDWLDIEVDKALEIQDKFFEQVFSSVYLDLNELYELKQKEEVKQMLGNKKEVGSKIEEATGEVSGLEKKYTDFSNSSFFANAIMAEKTLVSDVAGDGDKLKDLFYQAINAGDKVKTFGFLRHIFSIDTKAFFESDARYKEFLGKYLTNRSQQEVSNFSKDPGNKKYVVLFCRLVLEKKLKLGVMDSAMIGVTLGSIAANAGNEAYSDVAYGDEGSNGFVWNNFE